MIDLTYTKEQMLLTIKASTQPYPVSDLSDAALFQQEEVCLTVRSQTPDDLLPLLNETFARRFGQTPSELLGRELLYPLKKAVGNAYKWGNHKDPGKWVTVEATMTPDGAVVAVSNEGEGFAYREILERYRNDEHYFTHGGSGFDQFRKTSSLVTYADNGRCWLLCFLSEREPGKQLDPTQQAAFGLAGAPAFMMRFFRANLPHLQHEQASLLQCKLFKPHEPADEEAIGYVVEYNQGEQNQVQTLTLVGRLLPEAAASIEWQAAKQLYALDNVGIRISQPVAFLPDPPLPLFAFNPARDLRRHLKVNKAFSEMSHMCCQTAQTLRCWHRSSIQLAAEESVGSVFNRYKTLVAEIETILKPTHPQHVARLDCFLSQLRASAELLTPVPLVPIHGNFGLHAITHDLNQFYISYLDSCRYSHPGFDVGGFLADLARFYEPDDDPQGELTVAAEKVFVDSYFAGRGVTWQQDLPFFVAGAMLLRLYRLVQRPFKKWQPKIDDLLAHCERALEA